MLTAVLVAIAVCAAASPVPDGDVTTCTTLQGGLKALCNGTLYTLLTLVGPNADPYVA